MADAMLANEADRDELVERLITAERRARLAERALRDMQQHYGEDVNASYTVALLARIDGLEKNLERLARRGKAA